MDGPFRFTNATTLRDCKRKRSPTATNKPRRKNHPTLCWLVKDVTLDTSCPHGEKPCAVPARSSDDRVYQIIGCGTNMSIRIKTLENPQACLYHVCTPRANGTCIDRCSTIYHFAAGIGPSVRFTEREMDEKSTFRRWQSIRAHTHRSTHSAFYIHVTLTHPNIGFG